MDLEIKSTGINVSRSVSMNWIIKFDNVATEVQHLNWIKNLTAFMEGQGKNWGYAVRSWRTESWKILSFQTFFDHMMKYFPNIPGFNIWLKMCVLNFYVILIKSIKYGVVLLVSQQVIYINNTL